MNCNEMKPGWPSGSRDLSSGLRVEAWVRTPHLAGRNAGHTVDRVVTPFHAHGGNAYLLPISTASSVQGRAAHDWAPSEAPWTKHKG
jgi:hypothetical protein